MEGKKKGQRKEGRQAEPGGAGPLLTGPQGPLRPRRKDGGRVGATCTGAVVTGRAGGVTVKPPERDSSRRSFFVFRRGLIGSAGRGFPPGPGAFCCTPEKGQTQRDAL